MKTFSHIAQEVPLNGIREFGLLASQIPDCIRLEIGEPDFPTPGHIVDAAFQAIRDGFTGYTPTSGLPSLRALCADRVTRVTGVPTDPGQINVTPGGTAGLVLALISLLDPGDEVLVPDPGWPNYPMAVKLANGVTVRYPLDAANGFLPDVAALAERVTPRTKVLVVNTPSNPTGAVFPAATTDALAAFASRRDLFVLADEVYDEMLFDGEHHGFFARDPDRTVVVYSLSKSYAMTGWRVGYTAAPPALADLMGRVQEPLVACVSAFVQKAAEAALTGPQDSVREMRDSYRGRRDMVVALLREHNLYRYTPRGAFFALVDAGAAGPDAREFALRLLSEAHVSTVPGVAFGDAARDQIRLSMAAPQDRLREGVRRIARLLRT